MTDDTISDAKKAFLAALSAAQGAFEPIIKNKTASIRPRDASKTPYQFKYAELAEILRAVRPAMMANGLSLRSRVVPREGYVWIQSILGHADGHEDVSEMILNIDAEDIKIVGGRIAFLRRYMGSAQLGIASEDDADEDGQEPGGDYRSAPPPPARPPPQRAVKPAPKPPESPDGWVKAAPSSQVVGFAELHHGPPIQTTKASPTGAEPEQSPPPTAATKIQSSQAKWLRMKLESLFDEAGAAAFLATQGIEAGAIEDITEAQFGPLRAALIAL